MVRARLARLLVTSAATACALSLALSLPVVAQTPAAAPATPAAPAAPKKYSPPVRGAARVQITAPTPKRVGTDLVTTFRVKNAMEGSIAGFKIEEFWYDDASNVVGGGTYRHRTPLQAGEIVTVTLTTPYKATFKRNNYQFTHANGKIQPEKVTKLQ